MIHRSLLIAFAVSVSNFAHAEEEYEIRPIENSASFSQVIAVNANLEVLGVREVGDESSTVLRNFFRSGDSEIEIKPPQGFTNLEPQALSDNGQVVGYISRPIGNAEGSLRAFVWDSKSKELVQLSPLDGDLAANAQDINADGTRITGYSTGSNPPRMRPCLWQIDAGKKSWNAIELSSILDQNPYLQASQVVISPNGKLIAACITEKQIAEFIYDSSLFIWKIGADGVWKSTKISDEQPKLKDMNDAGVMVGSITDEVNTQAIRIDLTGKIDRLGFLPDDVSSVAYSLTNSGIIVGLSDDPPGKDGGPQAFIWKAGNLSALPLPLKTVDSAALSINQDGVIGGFILRDVTEDSVTTAFLAIPVKNKTPGNAPK